MSNYVTYSDFFGKNHISSTMEYVFTGYIAKGLSLKGYAGLSLDGVTMPNLSINDEQRIFLDNAVLSGVLKVSEDKFRFHNTTPWEVEDFLYTQDGLFMDSEDGNYCWTMDFGKNNYPRISGRDNYLLTARKQRFTILALAAAHLINVWEGKTDKKVVFHFDENASRSAVYYKGIALLHKAIPAVKDYVDLNLDIDLGRYDYHMHLSQCVDQGRNVFLAPEDKVRVMDELGYRPGGIYVLWLRTRRSANNDTGDIHSRSLVRLDEVKECHNRLTAKFTRIPEPRSRAEKYLDYLNVSEGSRVYLSDYLSPTPSTMYSTDSISLLNLAIHNFIYSEDYILLKLDTDEVVSRVLGKPGNPQDYSDYDNLRAVDFIHFVLKDNGFEFNEELYLKNYYPEGAVPLYTRLSN